MSKKIYVKSEYGKLRRVMLHRPGEETENLTPSNYEELLFDDAYYLKRAREEHDAFANVLKNKGVDVIYLEDLVSETLDSDKEIKQNFIHQFIHEGKVDEKNVLFEELTKYFSSFKSTKEMVLKMMAGVRYTDLSPKHEKSLSELSSQDVFVLKPLPNLVFTRDPFSTIGEGVSLHTMHFETRKRETLFGYYIFKYHPIYKGTERYYKRKRSTSIEGGDVMILSDKEIAVGISQRTEAASITKLAETLFSDKSNSTIERIYAIDIPKGRSWMHLDTVFTQIDKDKFAIFSNYEFDIFKIEKTKSEIKISQSKKDIGEVLKEIFGVKSVTLIHCGNGDPIHSEREQWNDGSNVLAIAPNEVITYERNFITNKALREAGVIVHEIPSSELSRGRGGPRCMSMPFVRDDVK